LVAAEAGVEPDEAVRRVGKNLLGINCIADDFDAPLPEEILRDFGM
jgi:hypothetical protein